MSVLDIGTGMDRLAVQFLMKRRRRRHTFDVSELPTVTELVLTLHAEFDTVT